MDFNPAKIKLIIGLGNPDKKYSNTYHNVGHLAVDYLIKSLEALPGGRQVKAKSLKSNVYMNQSGRYVKSALKKYNVRPEEALIIHDDSDITIGKYKLSFRRGAAGHKGVESIIKALGTKNFWRLRIGVRPISPISPISPIGRIKRKKARELVLKKITLADKKFLDRVFEEATSKL